VLPKGSVVKKELLDFLLADGRLPIGVSGSFGFAKVLDDAGAYVAASRKLLELERLPPIAGEIPLDEWILEIYQSDVTPRGLYLIKPGKTYDGDLISFWIRFAAASLLHPNFIKGELTGSLLGIKSLHEFPQVHEPEELLKKLLSWYGEGLTRPLHFFPGMAMKFAEMTEKNDPRSLRRRLTGRSRFPLRPSGEFERVLYKGVFFRRGRSRR
jgi:exodeoxyribonuclease V gamma subunit